MAELIQRLIWGISVFAVFLFTFAIIVVSLPIVILLSIVSLLSFFFPGAGKLRGSTVYFRRQAQVVRSDASDPSQRNASSFPANNGDITLDRDDYVIKKSQR